MEIESEPTSVPSVDELVRKLKQQNPIPGMYVPGFYFRQSRLLKRYEERIQEEAMRLHDELQMEEREKSKQARIKAGLEAAEKKRLHEVAQRILQFGPEVDYIGLSGEERLLYGLLSRQIERKPLDDWTNDEKCVYRFWHGLRPPDLPKGEVQVEPINPTEIRGFIDSVKQQQDEQTRMLWSIKWAIIGFSTWFVIKFILLPSLM